MMIKDAQTARKWLSSWPGGTPSGSYIDIAIEGIETALCILQAYRDDPAITDYAEALGVLKAARDRQKEKEE